MSALSRNVVFRVMLKQEQRTAVAQKLMEFEEQRSVRILAMKEVKCFHSPYFGILVECNFKYVINNF